MCSPSSSTCSLGADLLKKPLELGRQARGSDHTYIRIQYHDKKTETEKPVGWLTGFKARLRMVW